jgi:transcriptional/translational regulatory protein YebC/TACO1
MIEEDGVPQGALVSCSVAEIQVVSTNLQQEGLSVGEQLLVYAPNTTIEVSDPDHVKKLVKMLEVFEDNDDVQNVFQNAEIDDSLL